jgi:dihydrofolate synthase / folylpolyglutamate synthase
VPPHVAATAITSIALEHQKYLGTNLGEIAFEKAGIIKPGVPVVTGPLDPEAAAVIERVARERGAELIRAATADAASYDVRLPGVHQRTNAAVAVHLLRILDASGIRVPSDAVAAGLAHPGWPGRLETRRLADGRELLLDAAHNPAGAAALASYLTITGGAMRPMVFAAMRDKNAAGMFTALLPAVSHIVLTRASTARSADPDALAACVRAIAPRLPVTTEPVVADALTAAWRHSPRIVVAGSIFLLGDVIKLIDGT